MVKYIVTEHFLLYEIPDKYFYCCDVLGYEKRYQFPTYLLDESTVTTGYVYDGNNYNHIPHRKAYQFGYKEEPRKETCVGGKRFIGL